MNYFENRDYFSSYRFDSAGTKYIFSFQQLDISIYRLSIYPTSNLYFSPKKIVFFNTKNRKKDQSVLENLVPLLPYSTLCEIKDFNN